MPAEPVGRPLLGVLMVMGAMPLFAGKDTVTRLLVTQYLVPAVAAVRHIAHLCLVALSLPGVRNLEGFTVAHGRRRSGPGSPVYIVIPPSEMKFAPVA